MRTCKLFFHFVVTVAAAAVCLSPLLAYGDGESSVPAPRGGPAATPVVAPPAPGPSRNNSAFATLRARCETEVACGKASGDVCAEAALILLGSDPPDAFRDMSESQRGKVALRMLERGVDNSNIARALAYDMYSKTDFFGLSGYTDAYRASELMNLMVKSGYPGGFLRKARSSVGLLSFGSSEVDKREACAGSRKLLDEGKLDADSAKIAREVVATGNCVDLAQSK